MRALKVHYFLFLAVFMLAAKPFVGFHAVKRMQQGKTARIFVKAFTKRKQEYVEDSAYNVLTVQKRLADPLLPLTVLFSFLLSTLFPSLFKRLQQITTGFLSAICLSLCPPIHRYLLLGKLTI